MDDKLVKDWIVITLTNINQNQPTSPKLFNLPGNSASASTEGQVVENIPIADFGVTWNIEYYDNGVFYEVTSPVINSQQDIVDFINETFNATLSPCSFYIDAAPGFFNVYSFSSTFVLSLVKTGSNNIAGVPTGLNVINDSFATVLVESSDLTYNELSTELTFQPYLLEWVNVYANNIDQANSPFQLNGRDANGRVYERPNHPSLSPMAKQFVNENIILKYSPSATNQLPYKLGPGETVRLIFGYTNKDMISLPEKEIIVEREIIPEIPIRISSECEYQVPLIALVCKKMKNVTGSTLKGAIKSSIVPRPISKQEVFSAFNGYDFKELP